MNCVLYWQPSGQLLELMKMFADGRGASRNVTLTEGRQKQCLELRLKC